MCMAWAQICANEALLLWWSSSPQKMTPGRDSFRFNYRVCVCVCVCVCVSRTQGANPRSLCLDKFSAACSNDPLTPSKSSACCNCHLSQKASDFTCTPL